MRKLLLSLFTVVAALSMANAGEVTFDLTKPDLFGFAVPTASSGTDLNDGTLEDLSDSIKDILAFIGG